MARIEPLAPRDWPTGMKTALAALKPAAPRHPLPPTEGRPKALNALGVLAHNPGLAEAFNTFNGHVLFGSSLSPRVRELLVLRVAWLRQCDYEWAQHSVLARDAGLDAEEIRRVAAGPDAEGWSDLDAALVRAAGELVEGAELAEATWSVLAGAFGPEELLDLVFTVGAYDVLAMAFKSFGVELDADVSGNELRVPMEPEPPAPVANIREEPA